MTKCAPEQAFVDLGQAFSNYWRMKEEYDGVWLGMRLVEYNICQEIEHRMVEISLLKRVLYRFLRKSVGFSFNILNIFLVGNLPPQGCISVIVEDQGRYLLLKRPGGTLVFPGGFIRWREHPTQTAVREFKEETGLRVELHHIFACYANTSKSFGSMSTLTLVFCGEVSGGEMRGSVEGQPCWIEESNLLEKVDFRYENILNDYRAHRKQHSKQEFCGTLVREMAEGNL